MKWSWLILSRLIGGKWHRSSQKRPYSTWRGRSNLTQDLSEWFQSFRHLYFTMYEYVFNLEVFFCTWRKLTPLHDRSMWSLVFTASEYVIYMGRDTAFIHHVSYKDTDKKISFQIFVWWPELVPAIDKKVLAEMCMRITTKWVWPEHSSSFFPKVSL